MLLLALSMQDDKVHIITCDVQQGDAILIVYKSTEVLIDGGPNNRVINCLSKYLPFWDRKIELVVLTHPESDHYIGLLEVFRRYNVQYFWSNDLINSSQEIRVLSNRVGGKENMKFISGPIQFSLLYLDPYAEGNKKSIITQLEYGRFKALFTGDAEQTVQNKLISEGIGQEIFLKIPHHGSKNGLTQEFLNVVKPKISTISVGKNNYGQPHESTLKMLKDGGYRYLRTDEAGDIEVITDGESWWGWK